MSEVDKVEAEAVPVDEPKSRLANILKIEKPTAETFKPIGRCETFDAYQELLGCLASELSVFIAVSKEAEAAKARSAWRVGRAIISATGLGEKGDAPEATVSQISMHTGINRQTLQKSLLVARQYETKEALERMIENFMQDKMTTFAALTQLLVVKDESVRENLLERAASDGMTTKQARNAVNAVYETQPEALSEASRKKRDAAKAKAEESESADEDDDERSRGCNDGPRKEQTPVDKTCRELGRLTAVLSSANDQLDSAVLGCGEYDKASTADERAQIKAQLQSVYDMADALNAGLKGILPRMKVIVTSKGK